MSDEGRSDGGPAGAEDGNGLVQGMSQAAIITQLRPVTVLTGPDEPAINEAFRAMSNVSDRIDFVSWRTDGETLRLLAPKRLGQQADEREFSQAERMSKFDEGVSYLFFTHPLADRHPRYHVALGDEIVRHVADGKESEEGEADEKIADYFVIATYSDFIIDHMCNAIRDGLLAPDDFAVIDFRFGEEPEVVTYSEHGQVMCSVRYRRWYLDEQRRFLGIEPSDSSEE